MVVKEVASPQDGKRFEVRGREHRAEGGGGGGDEDGARE